MWELWLRPIITGVLALCVCMPLEHLFALHPRRRRAIWTDLAFLTFGQILTRLGLVFGAHRLLDELASRGWDRAELGLSPSAAIAVDLGLGLLLFELFGYAYHRLAHAVPWLWRLHEVHHSSEAMDGLASFRQHPLEIVLMTLMQNVPLVLLGIPLGTHAFLLLLLKLNTVFVHSNIRLDAGPLALLFATPRFHHRHHQRFGATKNFATLLPCIDWLFGTYSKKSSSLFGLERRLPESFWGLLSHPFRRGVQ